MKREAFPALARYEGVLMSRASAQGSDEMTDAELVIRMAARDADAFVVIYARLVVYVGGVLQRYGRGLSSAVLPVLCQVFFLSAFDSAGRYRDDGKFRAWLCGIALHKVRQVRGRHVRRFRLFDRWRSGRSQNPPGTSEQRATTRIAVERALAGLSDAHREVLFLHTVEQLTGEEIALALGVKLKTVWTRLHRARAAMCKALTGSSEEGVG
jgi:RNA polymerase sigma-70 factor (ECF subfamily)